VGATKRLAEFIHDLSYDDLSEEAVAKAKLCLMDWLGVAVRGYIAGRREMDSMIDALTPFFGQPQATLLTKKTRVDVLNAALINGTASHYLDYDDVHPMMLGHPSVPIMPAVLALGELKGANGKVLITAIVAGFEAQCKIGEAVWQVHYKAGWHATSTLGCFGACAAAAKILGLNTEKIINSLGTAGTQAFGSQQSFGTMTKPFHAGKAASNGVLAAILAERGFTGPQEIIEGPKGFSKLYSSKFDETKINNFGKPFEIESTAYKRHASCYGTHSAITGTLKIREKYHPEIEKIDSINIKASWLTLNVADKLEPKTGLEGKFSVGYCVALALLKGRAFESDFTDELVNSKEVKDLMNKIKVIRDESFGELESEVEINMKNGQTIKEKTNIATEFFIKANEWVPIVEMKFTDLVKDALPTKGVRNIVDTIKNLEKEDDLKWLTQV